MKYIGLKLSRIKVLWNWVLVMSPWQKQHSTRKDQRLSIWRWKGCRM